MTVTTSLNGNTTPTPVLLRQKVMVLGNATSGKSAMIQMFQSDGTQYPKSYAMTTTPQVTIKTVRIPDTLAQVEMFLVDMPGHDMFQENNYKYCDGAAAFAVIYDVTNPDSFQHATEWIQLVRRMSMTFDLPGVLIANKIDLQQRRQITTRQGEDYARESGVAFFEMSAAENRDVALPFYFLANSFYQHYNEMLDRFKETGNKVSV